MPRTVTNGAQYRLWRKTTESAYDCRPWTAGDVPEVLRGLVPLPQPRQSPEETPRGTPQHHPDGTALAVGEAPPWDVD